MTKVPNGIEMLPKISIACVGRTNVTDDRRWTGDDSERNGNFIICSLQLFKTHYKLLQSEGYRCDSDIMFMYIDTF